MSKVETENVTIKIVGIGSSAIILVLALVFLFVPYTNYIHTSGRLTPETGFIKLASPIDGQVTKRTILNGQTVKTGEDLFVISSERYTKNGATRRQTSLLYARQIEALNLRKKQTNEQYMLQISKLQQKLFHYKSQLSILNEVILLNARRVGIDNKILEQYRNLAGQGFFGNTSVLEKERLSVESIASAKGNLTLKESLLSEIADSNAELSLLPGQKNSELSQIDGEIGNLTRELMNLEASTEILLKSPMDAFVTTSTNQGDSVIAGEKLAVLVASNASFVVEAYVSTKDASHLKVGDKAIMEYSGYPKSKFGTQKGIIKSINRIGLKRPEGSDIAEANVGNTLHLVIQLIGVFPSDHETNPLFPGLEAKISIVSNTRTIFQIIVDRIG